MEEKPKYLWHGASGPIDGNTFFPRKATDIRNVPENVQVAVYATDNRDAAIAMAVLKSNGVTRASLDFDKVPAQGIAYEGWPAQEHVYLYKLPSDTFRRSREGSRQWVSAEPVRYESVEELLVKDWIHLIRKPTLKEKTDYEKRFNVRLKD